MDIKEAFHLAKGAYDPKAPMEGDWKHLTDEELD
ncbi:hypothetical protein MNBD_GAMMA04-1066, partial [hydrothermal vent metagenome]